jgi:HK97 gp10 family phage protein
MEAAVAGAVEETAHAIEQDVKGNGPHAAPIRTGNLRRSYHTDRKGLANPVEPSVEVGNDMRVAPYALFVEYGTSRMAPRPHLTPASEAQQGPHHARVAAAVAGVAAKANRLHGTRSGSVASVADPAADAGAEELADAEQAIGALESGAESLAIDAIEAAGEAALD